MNNIEAMKALILHWKWIIENITLSKGDYPVSQSMNWFNACVLCDIADLSCEEYCPMYNHWPTTDDRCCATCEQGLLSDNDTYYDVYRDAGDDIQTKRHAAKKLLKAFEERLDELT